MPPAMPTAAAPTATAGPAALPPALLTVPRTPLPLLLELLRLAVERDGRLAARVERDVLLRFAVAAELRLVPLLAAGFRPPDPFDLLDRFAVLLFAAVAIEYSSLHGARIRWRRATRSPCK